MIELILHPNERIDGTLLLSSIKEYNDRTSKPVNVRILDANLSFLNNDFYDYLNLYFEIRQSKFVCQAYAMEDGKIDKTKITKVNASWETIPVQYKICKEIGTKFYVENDQPIFRLLNYALQENKRIQRGNKQGFKGIEPMRLEKIFKGLTFGAVVKEINGQDILLPLEMEDIPRNY